MKITLYTTSSFSLFFSSFTFFLLLFRSFNPIISLFGVVFLFFCSNTYCNECVCIFFSIFSSAFSLRSTLYRINTTSKITIGKIVLNTNTLTHIYEEKKNELIELTLHIKAIVNCVYWKYFAPHIKYFVHIEFWRDTNIFYRYMATNNSIRIRISMFEFVESIAGRDSFSL